MGKTLLIVGGGVRQLPLIRTAKECGIRVVICDANDRCLGAAEADVFRMASTRDYDAVLKVARGEGVNGVISNSEPSMTVVSKVSEALNLVGNSYGSVRSIIEKDLFRKLQREAGLFAPQLIVASSLDEISSWGNIHFPIIIKPAESSGSRGVSVIESFDLDRISQVFAASIPLSRNGKVVIEEYVSMPSMTIYDGDVFVYGDEILWNGLFFSTRNPLHPLLPTTQTYPLLVDAEQIMVIKDAVKRLFKGAGIVYGEFNLEMYFTKEGELFIIEINVRQGGNGIPLQIKKHSGIDFTKLLVTTAVGIEDYWQYIHTVLPTCKYICRHPVFSNVGGQYLGLHIPDELEDYVTGIDEAVERGSVVKKCSDASDVIAFVDLEFGSEEIQRRYFDKLNEMIWPVVK